MEKFYSEITHYTASAQALETALNEHLGLKKYCPSWDAGNLYWHSNLCIVWEINKDTSREVYTNLSHFHPASIDATIVEYGKTNGEYDERMYLEDVLHWMVYQGLIPSGHWLITNDD